MSDYTQMWVDLGLDHIMDMQRKKAPRESSTTASSSAPPMRSRAAPSKADLEKAGIPVLRLETDYSQEDAGQIKTRVEAFRERIEEK